MATATASSQQANINQQPLKRAPMISFGETMRDLPRFFWNGPLALLEQAYKRHGEVFRMNMIGGLEITSICHPDHIRQLFATNEQAYCKGEFFDTARPLLGEGLFLSEGQRWVSQRRLLQPEFTPKGVTNFIEGIVKVGNIMANDWEKHLNNKPIDMYQEMRNAAMRVICHTVLDYEITEQEDELSKAIDGVIDYISDDIMIVAQVPAFIPTPARLKFKKHLKSLDDAVYAIIKDKGEGDPEGSFVSRLLAAKDKETGYTMSSKLLRDEIMTIYLAGHETTALSLSWAWYLLSNNPSVEKRMHEEIDAVLNGRTPEIADMANLPYTLAVFKEAMRLYPPLWAIPRQAIQEDSYNGYRVKPGDGVMAAVHTTHHLPEFWDNPKVFRPERFLPENEAKQHNYAYLPFGAGPRTCMGNHFAMREGQILLALFGQRYRIKLAPGQIIRAKAQGTLRPAKPMYMHIEERRQT